MRKFGNSPAAAELGTTVAPRYLMHARPNRRRSENLEPCCIVYFALTSPVALRFPIWESWRLYPSQVQMLMVAPAMTT